MVGRNKRNWKNVFFLIFRNPWMETEKSESFYDIWMRKKLRLEKATFKI